jgi:hypothetical protein
MPNLKLEDLSKLYHEADQCDKEVFAEQRSNLLLVSGDHYQRKNSKYWNRIRDNRELNDTQKLRLTKNHTQVISKKYVNNIFTMSPGVSVLPKNESELQDVKSAEMREAVWQDAKTRYKLNKQVRRWCSSFVDIGEVAVKIFWDEKNGDLVGHEQEMDEESGQPKFDEFMQPIASDTPVFSGAFVFETIYGFNLLRDPSARSMDDSPWIGLRKMVDIKVLKALIGDDEEKAKALTAEQDQTYMVFDANQVGYRKEKDQTCVKEFYWKPSFEYPNGYYYIFTEGGILFEGELPFGVFPICYQSFDEVPTSARGRSLIKQLRPYQAEINRSASKIAEHQITLGDDKILTQGGTTLAHGGLLPGVRGITYSGAPPIIMQGRDGSQYLNYMNSQIAEMYQVAQIQEDLAEKQAQLEPMALLYQSVKQKKVYSLPAAKFEEFLIDICETYLRLHKNYVKDDDLILAIGRNERINIPEYRQSVDLGYQIKVEAQSDDIETKMGKQITFSNILQYVGQNLDKDDLGRLIKNLPYANNTEDFSDLTTNYENSKNDILLLDRGGVPQGNYYDDHVYIIKRLTARMKQPDFQFMAPQIKQNYQNYISIHDQMEADKQSKIAAAKSEYIPTGGYLVSLDFYVTDPTNPNKTRRARMPSQAVEWMIQKLEAQGMGLEKLESADTATQAQVAAKMLSGQQMPGQQPMDQGGLAVGVNPEGKQNGNTRSGKPVLHGFEQGATANPNYALR